MATLYIEEYDQLERTNALGEIPALPIADVEQTPVTISGTSAQSAAFAATTAIIRVKADVACHLKWGDDPTATTDQMRLEAGQEEVKVLKPTQVGTGLKVAVIQVA